MKYSEVARKLERLGCQVVRRKSGGSHRKWRNPVAKRSTVVPDWGGRDLKLGTIRGVVKQLALNWEAFTAA